MKKIKVTEFESYRMFRKVDGSVEIEIPDHIDVDDWEAITAYLREWYQSEEYEQYREENEDWEDPNWGDPIDFGFHVEVDGEDYGFYEI